jgi:hypothetical protein
MRGYDEPDRPKRIVCGHAWVTPSNGRQTRVSNGKIRQRVWPATADGENVSGDSACGRVRDEWPGEAGDAESRDEGICPPARLDDYFIELTASDLRTVSNVRAAKNWGLWLTCRSWPEFWSPQQSEEPYASGFGSDHRSGPVSDLRLVAFQGLTRVLRNGEKTVNGAIVVDAKADNLSPRVDAMGEQQRHKWRIGRNQGIEIRHHALAPEERARV